MQAVTPMIHVPDVRATCAWYQRLGFALIRSHEDAGELSWAQLSCRGSDLMLNAGGAPSDAPRREVDLYLQVDRVDALFAKLAPEVEVVEPPHNTGYGMREFVIRDPNRFWVTFGEPAPMP